MNTTALKYKNIDHLERGIVVALIKQILDFIEANQPKLRVVKSEAV